jgi:hypothetical protein
MYLQEFLPLKTEWKHLSSINLTLARATGLGDRLLYFSPCLNKIYLKVL